MKAMRNRMIPVLVPVLYIFSILSPGLVSAHCDTLDGPVVEAARKAFEKGDVTPVLKWVKKEHEQVIRLMFQKAMSVRSKGPEAEELADMYFFETLVRLHRAGEGAPFTGLKPAGAVEPAVAAADKSLETGSVDGLMKALTQKAVEGIQKRFTSVIEKKNHADESIEAGRDFVAAYVEYVHYVERLHLDLLGEAGHHGEPEAIEMKKHVHQ